jgi:hypothetical protein
MLHRASSGGSVDPRGLSNPALRNRSGTPQNSLHRVFPFGGLAGPIASRFPSSPGTGSDTEVNIDQLGIVDENPAEFEAFAATAGAGLNG